MSFWHQRKKLQFPLYLKLLKKELFMGTLFLFLHKFRFLSFYELRLYLISYLYLKLIFVDFSIKYLWKKVRFIAVNNSFFPKMSIYFLWCTFCYIYVLSRWDQVKLHYIYLKKKFKIQMTELWIFQKYRIDPINSIWSPNSNPKEPTCRYWTILCIKPIRRPIWSDLWIQNS